MLKFLLVSRRVIRLKIPFAINGMQDDRLHDKFRNGERAGIGIFSTSGQILIFPLAGIYSIFYHGRFL